MKKIFSIIFIYFAAIANYLAIAYFVKCPADTTQGCEDLQVVFSQILLNPFFFIFLIIVLIVCVLWFK